MYSFALFNKSNCIALVIYCRVSSRLKDYKKKQLVMNHHTYMKRYH